jgi:hypothetical protein
MGVSLRKFSSLLVLLGAVVLCHGQGNPVVGKFSAAKNAQISRGPSGASDFMDAKVGQPVREGFAVRTYRRSFAEITFTDKSALRINEQTDLIVQSAKTLRRIRLDRGQVWVRDESGSKTAVQTPVATATARGTVFLVSSDGTVTVKEGEVDLEANGVVVTVFAGETAGIGPGGSPQKLGGQNPGGGGQEGGDGNDTWYEKAQDMPVPGLDLGGMAAVGGLGFGLSGGGREPNSAPVPEPATMIALATGAGALVLKRRRKHR